MVNEKILQARSELQRKYEEKQKNVDDLISALAQTIITQNESSIGVEIADIAKENIEKDKKTREEARNVQKKSKTTRATNRAQ